MVLPGMTLRFPRPTAHAAGPARRHSLLPGAAYARPGLTEIRDRPVEGLSAAATTR